MTSSTASPKIGLALGGGGARGLAHIPVLEAFDDLGLKPHKIAGTSIGAIMGAGYAGGLSGSDLREITLSTLADRNAVLKKVWELRPRRFFNVFKNAPLQLDPHKVLEIFIGAHIKNTFEDLDISLRILATDFYGCKEVAFESGPLLPAIAASIAIPAVFKPVQHNGRLLVDGGAVNPLPFDELTSSCDIVVAIDIVGDPLPREDGRAPGSVDMLYGTIQILMQTISAEKLKRAEPDILLSPNIETIRALDFLKAKRILSETDYLREELKQTLPVTLNQLRM